MLSSNKKTNFKIIYLLTIFLLVNRLWVAPVSASSFLCRSWENSNTGSKIGESFISEIKDGVISFRGHKKPISFGQFIYSHPYIDIFMAASGELITVNFKDNFIKINVYFPNKSVSHFVKTNCSKV